MFCTKFRPLFNNVLCNNNTVDHNTTPITTPDCIAMISKTAKREPSCVMSTPRCCAPLPRCGFKL